VALGRLELIGAALVAVGIATMAVTGLSHIPAVFAYVAWLIAGESEDVTDKAGRYVPF
jgi:hypothetical protein